MEILIKVQELVKKLFKLVTVMLNGFRRHHLPHIRPTGGIPYHTCTAADENNRRMTVLLHPHHDDDLHEVTHMQAVRRGVESDIKPDFLLAQQFPNLFFVCGLFDESPFF